MKAPTLTFSPGARAGFFWQGALILLPAIVLAASGFYSLRQDRMLAEHQALEQAKASVGEIAQRFIRATRVPPPGESELERAREGLSVVTEDPVFQAVQRAVSEVAFQLNTDRLLAYPPPIARYLPPEPLDSDELNAGQFEAWRRLQQSGGDDSSTQALDEILVEFLSTGPPPRFAAIVRARAALVFEKTGRLQSAFPVWRDLSTSREEVMTESGFPMREFAGLHLLELLPRGSRSPVANRVAGRLLAQPTALSERMLIRIEQLEPSAGSWRAAWDAHERVRKFFEHLSPSLPHAQWSSFEGERYIVIREPLADGEWLRGLSESALTATAREVVRRQALPAHFAATISLAGFALPLAPEVTNAAELLAGTTAALASDGVSLPVAVQVYLADSGAYYAQQRARTVRFGALIALATLAVLIGFLAAGRAFRRQQQLGEMKTNFVSSVSHELRAPIASVRFMAEELEQGTTPSPAKLQEYHRFIVQECRRLSAVIENVLDFSRREQGREKFEFEPVDLVRLFEESVRLMQTYGGEKGVVIEPLITGTPVEIEADGRALQRLLVNLLDNARKHSPENGRVSARLEFEERRVFIRVVDEGPGIPREEHARIFERFYRIGSELRRETQGVGLGLSIVKHIATVHGGRVHLESAPGRGSTFSVEFPVRRTAELSPV